MNINLIVDFGHLWATFAKYENLKRRQANKFYKKKRMDEGAWRTVGVKDVLIQFSQWQLSTNNTQCWGLKESIHSTDNSHFSTIVLPVLPTHTDTHRPSTHTHTLTHTDTQRHPHAPTQVSHVQQFHSWSPTVLHYAAKRNKKPGGKRRRKIRIGIP